MLAVAIPAGLLIGLSLGALGGGSILTVPALGGRGHAEHLQAVVDHADREAAEHDVQHPAAPAEQATAADDRGRDGVQEIPDRHRRDVAEHRGRPEPRTLGLARAVLAALLAGRAGEPAA